MKCFKNIFASIIILVLFNGILFAQNEIPVSIKDKIDNGIKYLENAKVPADMDKAIKEFTDAGVIAPEFPDVHYYLGKTLSLIQGNAGKAIKEYKKYLEMYPDAPDKDAINKEISEMEDIIKTKYKSSLMGVSLVGLPDGIFIRQVSPNYPVKGRRPLIPVYVGDKILKINKVDLKNYTIRAVLKLVEEDVSADDYREVEIFRAGKSITVKMLKKGQNSNTAVRDIGEEDLSSILSLTKTSIAVFFTSDWCTQCEDYNRVTAYYALKYKKSITFLTANVDESTTIAKDFGINKTPSIYLYKGGKYFDKYDANDSKILENKLEELIK